MLVLRHVRAGTLELLRYPAYSVPTLAFPTLLFLLFAAPSLHGKNPDVAMAAFLAMAVLGVVLFQFGVGIAAERASPWESFLRVLPVPVWARLLARVLSALLFATAACAVLIATAVVATPVTLSPEGWLGLVLALLFGSLPFGFLGIALGYWIQPKAALPVANLLFLPLAYTGGLFGGPRSLPGSLAGVSPYVPTRQWGNWLWHAVDGDPWRPEPILLLAIYATVFALLSVWGYRRDEGERFS